MPSKKRQPSSTNIYHVVITSINHMQVFEDDHDYRTFLRILFDCEKKFDSIIYAYCLMANHIHIIIHISFPCLSTFIQSLSARFVWWYNRKYNRIGSLMQANFFSTPVETPEYLLRAIRYVHDNPVKADICSSAKEYPWSSYRAYSNGKSRFLYLDKIVELLGPLKNVRTKLSKIGDDELIAEQFEPIPKEKPVIEDHALSIYHSITGCKSTSDFRKLPKDQRNEYIRILKDNRLTLNQISRLTGTPNRTVSRVLHKFKTGK